ncbi:UDP-N-acetylmuramoyl-tripeptide--D-alanyl-D-alanine ligase [Friedmanniella luteola]|uniref:UDP-N-acetylmuramoyl-tripeptide--D-alanyl-D-alanine ligase n=1 Tax=Friedmanniella luteola TaxID=546871 RepID=A0A1H1PBU0_9ACTN|nr:UDP-N-acetylmuramoyl-tripeptide--D-alanyl-D-alanine ligase [Friedmanniella luteola]SDS08746.1 UDP-N-acetylmuramoyl-tripeptide--D-alanyl-D-alanine ligase [Friedmanniella luteola]
MIGLSVAEVAEVVGAELTAGDPDALVTSVVADSRAVVPGALFVALAGSRVDGHDLVVSSWRGGAVAALTGRDVPPAPCLPVDDQVTALGRVARRVVDRGVAGGLQVVGITGSQGKTSTKDLLAQVLEGVGPTVAPVGNLNNELGVPLTVCRVEPGTRFLVAELGARGVGHIAYLCDVVAPRVGVVLNVGQAHVGEFGGQDAIARAKGELVEALPATGVAVLNAEDPRVWAMRSRTVAPVLAFAGSGGPPPPGGPALWAEDLTADRLGRHAFALHARDAAGATAAAPVVLRLTGRHQVPNAVAAAAAAVALGLPLDVVAAALSAAGPRSRWRMELHERADGVVVVNDSYNANPDSMRAAVGTLVELGRSTGGRTVAVVGDMLELGDSAEAEHADLGRHLAEHQVGRVLALGEHAGTVVRAAVEAGLPPGAATAPQDKEEALAVLRAELGPGDVVLVKASRGLALDTVAEALVAPDAVPGALEHPSAASEEPA